LGQAGKAVKDIIEVLTNNKLLVDQALGTSSNRSSGSSALSSSDQQPQNSQVGSIEPANQKKATKSNIIVTSA